MATPDPATREDLIERYVRLAETACANADALRGLALASLSSEPRALELIEAVDAAEAHAKEGRFAETVSALLEVAAELRAIAERLEIDACGEIPRAKARAWRTVAEVGLADALGMNAEAQKSDDFLRAEMAFSQGESHFQASQFDSATICFHRAAVRVGELAKKIDTSSPAERLQALRVRRARLVDSVRLLPARGFSETQRDAALAAIRRCDTALEAQDLVQAAAALDQGMGFLRAWDLQPL
ncbi:MAG: hypothetical protein QOD06_2481, partial [Candidatus Binatota bacterium]|nr:hypothetical protein [Candidatus Binatota bacterium]